MVTRVMGAIQRQVDIKIGEAYTGTAEPSESIVVLNHGAVDAESNQIVFSEAAAEAILAALQDWSHDKRLKARAQAKCPHCGAEDSIDTTHVDEDGDGAYCTICGRGVPRSAKHMEL